VVSNTCKERGCRSVAVESAAAFAASAARREALWNVVELGPDPVGETTDTTASALDDLEALPLPGQFVSLLLPLVRHGNGASQRFTILPNRCFGGWGHAF
jgi:hypothetical protein